METIIVKGRKMKLNNIYIIGNGYLSKKLRNIIDFFDKITFIKKISNFDIFSSTNNIYIFSCFPSVEFQNYISEFDKKKFIVYQASKIAFKNNNYFIFFNSLRTQYQIINSKFDKDYIKYNLKFLDLSLTYKHFYNLLLPFIYDKDLIKKKNSVVYKIYHNILTEKDFDNQYIPFMEYKNFEKYLIKLIKKIINSDENNVQDNFNNFNNFNILSNILIPEHSLITARNFYNKIKKDIIKDQNDF